MNRREELLLNYEQTKRDMGIVRIRNEENGKLLLIPSPNIQGTINSQRFQLTSGVHRNKELQSEWKVCGETRFTIEVLELLDTGDDVLFDYRDIKSPEGMRADVVRDYKKQLQALERKWLDELQPYGERGYHKKGVEK
ncbi:GIY-YIG nuclease family protein [Paenibacillus sp. MBLB4367]|uniref:GIY-YIG nuclease family protein n=1 Tax=Paenibacillus sp. MBLB4367 TaxID=3384767 RepID=UPI0039082940